MTREAAIAYGKRVIDLGLNDETQAFCEMAIEALELMPDNATNGDVIKVLFPNAICIQQDTFVYIYKNKKKYELKAYLTKISKKWWNTPYEAESEEEFEDSLEEMLEDLWNAK